MAHRTTCAPEYQGSFGPCRAVSAVDKTVRQSVSLPDKVVAQVRSMAKKRRLSASRMLLELIENGIEAEKRKQREFFELAERFRTESNPEQARRLATNWADGVRQLMPKIESWNNFTEVSAST